jgi:hypothetical protein
MTEIRAVCVYCGSAARVPERYRATARRLGGLLAEHDIELIYGGGRVGLMGVVADAVLAGGGRAVGIIPDHIMALEVEHRGLSELVVVSGMHERKYAMFGRADAFVVLPGGLGTLDEMIEILTWKQLALHDKPVVLVNDGGYWQPLLGLVDHMIGQGFARSQHRRLFRVVDTVEDVLPTLALAPEPVLEPQAKWI